MGQRLWTLALILGVQGLVTQMVSWHYTLYCASFKGFGRLWCLCHCHTLPNSPTSTCKGSKLFLPVAGHPALSALSQGPAGTLTETHIQTLPLGLPGTLSCTCCLGTFLHFVFPFGRYTGERQQDEEGERRRKPRCCISLAARVLPQAVLWVFMEAEA